MPAQRGRSFLLKVSDSLSPPTFTTLAGLRTTSLVMAGEAVDVTNQGSQGFRELLAGAGTASLRISGAGVYQDDDAFHALRERLEAGAIEEYEITFEDGDVLEMSARVTALEVSGEHDGELTFSVTLESSGRWNYSRV